MAETIVDYLDDNAGYAIEVTDDAQVRVESSKGESATLTPDQAQKAIEYSTSDEIEEIGGGLAATNDDHKHDWVAIAKEGAEWGESFAGMDILKGHIASVSTTELQRAVESAVSAEA